MLYGPTISLKYMTCFCFLDVKVVVGRNLSNQYFELHVLVLNLAIKLLIT
jgi:hypothetical protein